ncbi:MAG: hypothetical protein CMJ35_00700 [Phycisphaerae bacterium]|nr:hypothetical protein [Phycisphaerae bacterium]MBM90119.1 hypothetical protein [Phycisphaerae bacterium]HCT43684.1 hypothetical protein [Phycisphaerales bacterium]
MTQTPQNNFGAPAHNWADGTSARRDGTSWVPAMLIGALIFAVGCGSGLLVGWFGGAASGFADAIPDMTFEPANITITTDAPQTAAVGQPITVTLTVSDINSTQRTIRDIDWSGTIVDNMDFGTINPVPQEQNPDGDYREIVFETPLGADQSQDFTFILTPRQVGTYNAAITVYVDDYNSERTEILIDVRDSDADQSETVPSEDADDSGVSEDVEP